MPRFFLHLFNGTGPIPDEEGRELADLDAAYEAAVKGIRSILADEVLAGVLDLCGRIEIADGGGGTLTVVRFAEAIELRLAPEPW